LHLAARHAHAHLLHPHMLRPNTSERRKDAISRDTWRRLAAWRMLRVHARKAPCKPSRLCASLTVRIRAQTRKASKASTASNVGAHRRNAGKASTASIVGAQKREASKASTASTASKASNVGAQRRLRVWLVRQRHRLAAQTGSTDGGIDWQHSTHRRLRCLCARESVSVWRPDAQRRQPQHACNTPATRLQHAEQAKMPLRMSNE
jgi:hypothetical protein